ncbi:conserved hypothetical protein [Talaromyces stipitatus ATCC 10500]|uniref:Fatty acid hydroxylase domain-containing protein n=1 Tax=Talaromyces stipitatus (strain ATCC 10500 / CBS 375.48 / QM 6759 / NRRL 1006) TaxID=441959 RepID=B8LXZ1_TALSN|nr:uncharacterized protein TSTA_062930 [Talaromyces stipitatus ATCC 10500]EED22806.1 conserved hypothetical protein [Talaromyces stipitatus ATCC 10500]
MSTHESPSKDSMKSTWRRANRDQWTITHWLLELLNVHHVCLDLDVPVHSKEDKVPYLPPWSLHMWVLFYASIPLVIHQVWVTFVNPDGLGKFATFNLYFFAFNAIIIRQTHILRRLAHRYGFLDGDKHERDGVPDVAVHRVAASLYKTTGSRLIMAVFLTYNKSQQPLTSLNGWIWWLPLEIGLYGIVLDFWFYWYHRAMHDINPLWKFHRTHHLTKHPNPLLSAYADHEQEFFDMAVIPFLTYISLKAMGLPMGFYDCAEIVIEDHDLHHRKGWRKSHNYGKQTRLWDRIFGTCHERIESIDSNIDYVNTAYMPVF